MKLIRFFLIYTISKIYSSDIWFRNFPIKDEMNMRNSSDPMKHQDLNIPNTNNTNNIPNTKDSFCINKIERDHSEAHTRNIIQNNLSEQKIKLATEDTVNRMKSLNFINKKKNVAYLDKKRINEHNKFHIRNNSMLSNSCNMTEYARLSENNEIQKILFHANNEYNEKFMQNIKRKNPNISSPFIYKEQSGNECNSKIEYQRRVLSQDSNIMNEINITL